MSGAKIIRGLEDAVAGNFASVTIEGQRWVRADASGWQPIETAPKDGTRFQAGHFDVVDKHFRQFVCFWNSGWAGIEGVSDQGPFWQGGGFLEHPTHWHPLPTPPAPEAQP